MGLFSFLIGDISGGNSKEVIQKRVIDTTNRVIQSSFISQTASCNATTTSSQTTNYVISGNTGGTINAKQNMSVAVNAKCFNAQNAQNINLATVKNDIQTAMSQKDFTEGWGSDFSFENSSKTLQDNTLKFLNETITSSFVSQVITQMGSTLSSQEAGFLITKNSGTVINVDQTMVVTATYDFTSQQIASNKNTADAMNKLVDSMYQEAVLKNAAMSWTDIIIIGVILLCILGAVYYFYSEKAGMASAFFIQPPPPVPAARQAIAGPYSYRQ